MNGRKPLVTNYSSAGTDGVAYYPTLTETAWAIGLEGAALSAAGDRVLIIDDSTESGGAGDVAQAIVPSLPGRAIARVDVDHNEELFDTMRDGGMLDPDVVLVVASPFDNTRPNARGRTLCDTLSDWITTLAIHPVVVTNFCRNVEGWYRVDLGFDIDTPSLDTGAAPILARSAKLGDIKGALRERTARDVAALMTVIHVVNEIVGRLHSDSSRCGADDGGQLRALRRLVPVRRRRVVRAATVRPRRLSPVCHPFVR